MEGHDNSNQEKEQEAHSRVNNDFLKNYQEFNPAFVSKENLKNRIFPSLCESPELLRNTSKSLIIQIYEAILQEDGWKTEFPPSKCLKDMSIRASKDSIDLGKKTIVVLVCTRIKTGSKTVERFLKQISKSGATKGVLVNPKDFNRAAVERAVEKKNKIFLVGCRQLMEKMKHVITTKV